ncbi:MAG: TSUP family transporter [Cyclobacteriaceae bacterium]|nr:TSUP family transporter [Cyclobacteriaceae bacterium]
MEIVGFLSAIIIGFTLGLIGGGGSILTVPVLVYLFHIEPVLATAYSLFVVGISASVGALNYMKKGLMNYKTAIIFAVPSFLAVFLTRKFLVPAIPDQLFTIGKLDITTDLLFILILIMVMLGVSLLSLNKTFRSSKKHLKAFLLVTPAAIMVFIVRQFVIPVIPENLIVLGDFTLTKNIGIMVFFALIMFISSFSMIKGGKGLDKGREPAGLIYNYPVIVLEGAIVGTITGLVGAGGGFLIIPALVLLVGLSMKIAVGTSLLIISVKSLLGFLGDIGNQEIGWTFLLAFTGLAVVGIFAGTYTTRFIDGNKLKKGFGWFVLIMAVYILINELFI